MSDLYVSQLPTGGTRNRRTQTMSTKLTPEEEGELQQASLAAGKKMGEWMRDVLLESARENRTADGRDVILLTEIVGIQLFLMNVLSPLTRGELVSAEQYESIIRAVQANKARTARELFARRLRTRGE
jgi:hypothetical protein